MQNKNPEDIGILGTKEPQQTKFTCKKKDLVWVRSLRNESNFNTNECSKY